MRILMNDKDPHEPFNILARRIKPGLTKWVKNGASHVLPVDTILIKAGKTVVSRFGCLPFGFEPAGFEA